MLQPPSLQPLIPQEHTLPNGNTLYLFPNHSLGLVKLDITLEAGSAYQTFKSQAHAASQLFGEATTLHTAQQMAEYTDFHGIVIERMADTCVSNISFYFLPQFADSLFPLIAEMFSSTLITPQLFNAYVGHRRAQLKTNFQKTSYLARNRHYEILYGADHPLGTYALPQDLDRLTLTAVADFISQYYRLASAHLVISGSVSPQLLALADQYLSPSHDTTTFQPISLACHNIHPTVSDHITLPDTVQSTIRIGRLLPFAWDSTDYSRFMVLNTVLGGYFGSRLMSNLREDKGYTYGIYSQTQIFRHSIVMYITADVAAQATEAAVTEINREIDLLRQEPVPDAELDRVRNFMMGDFIRSIDGTFEIAERYRHMVSTEIDERLSTNLMETLATVTPDQLLSLAQSTLTDLVTVTAGA
ncbi:MAG: insulinase family protein [Bacteroidales bacterium]|nr:insulinase family protein [Bacteroidales bacterium]